MTPVAILRQEPSEDGEIKGCTIIEYAGGPKRFARVWDHLAAFEWGWTLHSSAREVWRADG